jgi:MraZ protein
MDVGVVQRELYQGYGRSGIDAKGRLTIPATFRSTIDANSKEPSVTIALHEKSKCLIAYDQAWAHLLREELREDERAARASGENFDRDNRKRRAFGPVEKIPFDESGRCIIPAFHTQKANLTDLAFFYANGDTIEIWDPETLYASEEIDEDMKDLCRWTMSQKGRK